jgi:hypothetical protein
VKAAARDDIPEFSAAPRREAFGQARFVVVQRQRAATRYDALLLLLPAAEKLKGRIWSGHHSTVTLKVTSIRQLALPEHAFFGVTQI